MFCGDRCRLRAQRLRSRARELLGTGRLLEQIADALGADAATVERCLGPKAGE
jgi:hypothetical protein